MSRAVPTCPYAHTRAATLRAPLSAAVDSTVIAAPARTCRHALLMAVLPSIPLTLGSAPISGEQSSRTVEARPFSAAACSAWDPRALEQARAADHFWGASDRARFLQNR